MKKTSNEELVLLGKAGSPSGLKGEVRITLYQQDSTNLKEGKVLLLKHADTKARSSRTQQNRSSSSSRGDDHATHRRSTASEGQSSLYCDNTDSNKESVRCDANGFKVERVRYQGGRPVVKLEGIDDRNAAEGLRGLQVYIEPEDLEPLPEGEHYVRNLIGCRVVDIAAENGSSSRMQQNCSSTSAQGGTLQLSKELDSEDQCFLHDGNAIMDLGSITRCDSEGRGSQMCSSQTSGSEGREIGVLRDVIQNTAQSILEVETPEGKTVLVPAVDEFLEEIDEEERVIKVRLIPGFID